MKRCAIYARVSTKTQGQDINTQLLPLREYAERRGFTIVEEFKDRGISGSKDRRPALDKLMKAARAREIDAVIVARFDRFARSLSHLARALGEFESLGVDFISLSESIDTSTPQGRLLFGIFASIAEFERSLIVERVNAGLARARAEGTVLGRPAKMFKRDRVANLRQQGKSIRDIAKELGVARMTIARALGSVR